MPLIEVSLVEGRSDADIRALISALTETTVSVLGAPLESVRVIIRPVAAQHWAAGNITIEERKAEAGS